MKLETKRLILRPITESDAKDFVNNLNISKWLISIPYPYTMKDAKLWIKHSKKEVKKKPRTSYIFEIERKEKLGTIGGCGIIDIKKDQGRADLGYWLGQDYWRQGYVTEGLTKLINYAFDELELRRLTIPTFVENKASNGLAKKLGFTYEGTLRKFVACKATGKIHNENIWGLLKEDWKKRIS